MNIRNIYRIIERLSIEDYKKHPILGVVTTIMFLVGSTALNTYVLMLVIEAGYLVTTNIIFFTSIYVFVIIFTVFSMRIRKKALKIS